MIRRLGVAGFAALYLFIRVLRSQPMAARRCSLCANNYPTSFARCPVCGDETDFMPNAEPMPVEEARALRSAAAVAQYFELRLLPAERERLLKVIRGESGVTRDQKQELVNKVLAANCLDLPLVEIDWAAAEAEARRRGGSVADLLFDEARAKDPE